MSQIDMKTRLVNLLKTIFQFEDSDLDFGIYRIMNQKREDIQNFIEKELVEKIVEQLELVGEEQRNDVTKDLEELKNKVIEAYTKEAFENSELKDQFKKLPLGKKYTEKLKELESIEVSKDLEREIYNHIYSFFSRYYDKGDFLSQRRYTHQGNERYAIPYDGEEVLLHWANKDQYYIKSTLNFKKYSFNANSLNVNFRIVTAEEEKGNVKAEEKRYFVVHEKKTYEFEGEGLNIYFEYRPLTDAEKNKRKFGKKTQISQSDINEYSYGFLKNKLDKEQKAKNLFKKENGKTVLEKNLHKYTTSNTADYFIHKNLEVFLKRELDFYLKNEVVKLEDLETGDMQKKLLKAKVIRNISDNIIKYLSQIEKFQRKLWEKKKIVLKTDYIITIDRLPKGLISQVMKNKEQLAEWRRLGFGKIIKEKDLYQTTQQTFTQDNKPVLKKLPIDTKHFESNFKEQLLELLSQKGDLEGQIDGLLLKSENWQALNLLKNKFKDKIKTIYIDPPFNTGGSEFIYKNNYRHSSWSTMIANRLEKSKEYLTNDGVIAVAIDDFELYNLGEIMDIILNEGNRLGVLVVESKPSGRTNDFFLATCHEYYLFYARNPSEVSINFFELSKKQKEQYCEEDEYGRYKWRDFLRTGGYSTPEERPNSFYPIYYNPQTEEIGLKKNSKTVEIFPIDSYNQKRVWRKIPSSFIEHVRKGDIKVEKGQNSQYKVYIKDRIKKGIRPKSVWVSPKYDASSHGSKLLTSLFGPNNLFTFPKSVFAVADIIKVTSRNNDYVLDYFAGSGTTAHAVMLLNKEQNLRRKFILVEMADYFDTVMIPRIKKVAYSFDWKDGKPTAANGSGVFCKYHFLEQYEDALENIEFDQKKIDEFNDYFVKYMLDFETKNSNTFLNIEKMENPFNYKLQVLVTAGKPAKTVTVDLVETFNYLIGLEVGKIKVNEENGRKYVFVTGAAADGEKILVVWRPLDKIDFKKDKEIIEKFRGESEADEVYINGDAAVKGFKQIESKFKAFLWD